ncbi:hypothetical protein PQR71_07735 [Paraburkholderia fungorum]|uniref:hypothetical protein n=1 Tax=Paraburkholderia fungorum TaxID=134537 RepID=UPI0038B8ABAB
MKAFKFVVIAGLACVSVPSFADTCRFDRFKLIEVATQALVDHDPEAEVIGPLLAHYDRKEWQAIATVIDDIAHDNGLTVRDAPEKYEDFMSACLKHATKEDLSYGPKYDAYIAEAHNYAESFVKSREIIPSAPQESVPAPQAPQTSDPDIIQTLYAHTAAFEDRKDGRLMLTDMDCPVPPGKAPGYLGNVVQLIRKDKSLDSGCYVMNAQDIILVSWPDGRHESLKLSQLKLTKQYAPSNQ